MKTGFGAGGIFQDCLPLSLQKHVPPVSYTSLDEERMGVALRASMRSIGLCNPNPAVGAAIYKNNQLVATGYTQPYGDIHAERMAIEIAQAKGIDLAGAELYVTLEPCSHQGRQPPCADFVAQFNWLRIVVGAGDPNPLVQGRGFERLKNFSLQRGILSQEIQAWNFPFFASQMLQRPVIVAKWAQTADGKLARADGKSQWISGETSRSYTHWLRQKYDVVVVGINTFLMDQPRLTVRDCATPVQEQPMALIFDPEATLIKKWTQFGDENLLMHHYVFCVRRDNAIELKQFLKNHSSKCSVVTCESSGVSALHDKSLIEQLGNLRGRPISSYFVEGGSRILSSLFEHGLVDLTHTFISSDIFGESPYQIHGSPLGEKNQISSDWSILQTANLSREDGRQADKLLELILRRPGYVPTFLLGRD